MMLKRKNLQIFFDGSLILKKLNVISGKEKNYIFYEKPATLFLKNYKLQTSNSIKNSIYRKKYFK